MKEQERMKKKEKEKNRKWNKRKREILKEKKETKYQI